MEGCNSFNNQNVITQAWDCNSGVLVQSVFYLKIY
jgi:hypothetical protein